MGDPRWKPRKLADPSTIAAFILLVVALAMLLLDGLDDVLFGKPVSFGYAPPLMLAYALYWLFGIIIGRKEP